MLMTVTTASRAAAGPQFIPLTAAGKPSTPVRLQPSIAMFQMRSTVVVRTCAQHVGDNEGGSGHPRGALVVRRLVWVAGHIVHVCAGFYFRLWHTAQWVVITQVDHVHSKRMNHKQTKQQKQTIRGVRVKQGSTPPASSVTS